MVVLPRRVVVLLIALIASLSVAGTALAGAKDVINDFRDGGVIDHCHPRADYDAARRETVDSIYGDYQGAIDDALANPTLVGTADRPCTEAGTSDGSGIGGAALVLIPIAAIVLGGAIVFARRRRGAGADGPDQPA